MFIKLNNLLILSIMRYLILLFPEKVYFGNFVLKTLKSEKKNYEFTVLYSE